MGILGVFEKGKVPQELNSLALDEFNKKQKEKKIKQNKINTVK